MRTYAVAAAQAVEETPAIPIKVGDREMQMFRPDGGQYAMFMAAVHSRMAGDEEKVAATIDLFMGCFDEDDQTYLAGLLLDRKNDFDMDTIERIMIDAVEEWSGRPTTRSTGSTRSRSSGGTKSTARTRR